MSEEEMDKLLKEVQELNKIDSAVESSVILKRKHLENELLKKKVNKYKEAIDKAIELLNNPWYLESGNEKVDEITVQKKKELLAILKEME